MITLVALVVALVFLPSPWNWLIVIVAAVIDLVETAVFVWWSKRGRAVVGVETLIGRRAVAVSQFAPTGQVRIDGELWEARSATTVDRGDQVVIRGVDGLVLDVEAIRTNSTTHTEPAKH